MRRDEITPRERVLLALQHQETDRVPVDFLATPETWSRLGEYLGVPHQESLLQYLGVDVRHPRLEYIGPPLPTFTDGSYRDAWGITWRPVPYEGGVYYEPTGHPLSGVQDASELEGYPWPNPDWWDVTALGEAIALWDREIEYAIFLEDFGDPGGFYEIANYIRGMEQVFTDMALNPDIPFEMMRHISEVLSVLAERVLTTMGERVDLIWTSDDIAHQHGMMMSLPMWKTLIFPHHKRFNQRVHALGGRVMYHSCGSITNALPGLVEMGIDVLDVLQFSADNMVPEHIKSGYGDQLCFHGGVDVQQLLPWAGEQEVRSTVRHLINVMGKGGGFILSPSHAIQVDAPPANILAVYEEAGSKLDELPTNIAASAARTYYGPRPPIA